MCVFFYTFLNGALKSVFKQSVKGLKISTLGLVSCKTCGLWGFHGGLQDVSYRFTKSVIISFINKQGHTSAFYHVSK